METTESRITLSKVRPGDLIAGRGKTPEATVKIADRYDRDRRILHFTDGTAMVCVGPTTKVWVR